MKGLKIYLILIIGACIAAVGIDFFLVPYKLVTGGLSGVGTILFYISNGVIPIGITIFVLNVPLFILGLRQIGRKFIFRSIIGMLVFSLVIDLMAPYADEIAKGFLSAEGAEYNTLLFSIYGGVLLGVGLGLVIKQGATTGGTDMLATLINKKYPHFSIAGYIAIFDTVIIATAALVFESIVLGLYSIISMYITSKLVDLIVDGMKSSRVFMIISDEAEKIAKELRYTMNRGVTFLKGRGAHYGEDKQVIYCVVFKHQVPRVKELVNEMDSHAFIALLDAREVIGEGFEEKN